MKNKAAIIFTLAFSIISIVADVFDNNQNNQCTTRSSCSSCIAKSACVWCVTKSKCTQNTCENGNIIYPRHIVAIMSGEYFCPRLVEEQNLIIKSGKKEFQIKITQIHIYMAFTSWKCKVNVNGTDIMVPAILLGDKVHCESVFLTNNSDEEYIPGSISLMWDHNKSLDGLQKFKISK
ncbi:hypothetical protein K1T71_005574 [Dendrolimus kikuchii]|uniref:Uncharacterized protein n=1 Tax=Dendrolimus kikuchii TaxID=765133 RepID=A0ACC1D4E7_9NEOP|nr:hypothetical protein K1T71_005574 [Dendrolimus kikuchii]